MTNFLLVFAAMLLYLAVWFGVTVAGGLAVRNGVEAAGVPLIIIGIAGFLLGLFPFMQWLAGAVFNYAGEGTPINESAMRQRILAIETLDAPIMVEERDEKLVVTWNYVDAQWWGVLSRSGMDQVYELHIKLDDKRKTARLIDVHKSVNWSVDPSGVRLRGGYSRGVDLSYQRVIGYGWDDAFQFGRVVDYEFRNSDIKQPIVNLLIENGWRVKFGLW